MGLAEKLLYSRVRPQTYAQSDIFSLRVVCHLLHQGRVAAREVIHAENILVILLAVA